MNEQTLLSLIRFVVEPSRIVCPIAHLQGGASTSSLPEEPVALQYSYKSLAICIVVGVSIYQDTQTWELAAALERLPF